MTTTTKTDSAAELLKEAAALLRRYAAEAGPSGGQSRFVLDVERLREVCRERQRAA
jgi:hypothetical protein